MFEKLYTTARRRAAGQRLGWLFRAAARTAVGYSRALDQGRPDPWLRLRRSVFETLVYGKLRAALGGRAS